LRKNEFAYSGILNPSKMFMEGVLSKLKYEVVKCEKLENSFKENGFVVPSEFTERKAELQFAYSYILNSDSDRPYGESFEEFWKSMKNVLTRYENAQDVYVGFNGCISMRNYMKIKECQRVLKVLETTFPDEVKAVEMPPPPAADVTTITPQAMATWLQNKPPAEDIKAILDTIEVFAPKVYKEHTECESEHSYRELVEGIQALLNKQ
jgi:hypothetical protein